MNTEEVTTKAPIFIPAFSSQHLLTALIPCSACSLFPVLYNAADATFWSYLLILKLKDHSRPWKGHLTELELKQLIDSLKINTLSF